MRTPKNLRFSLPMLRVLRRATWSKRYVTDANGLQDYAVLELVVETNWQTAHALDRRNAVQRFDTVAGWRSATKVRVVLRRPAVQPVRANGLAVSL